MTKFLVLAVAAVLSGCAIPAKVISSSQRSVVVQARIQDVGQAQSLADAECRRVNRSARFAMKATDNQFAFDCVQ